MRSLWSALIPTGIRRLRRHRHLKKQLGLVHLGTDADYTIVDSTFGHRCRVSGRVSIVDCSLGDFSYVETGARIHSTTVGRFSSIAPYAVIGLAEHPTDGYVSTHPAFYLHRPELGYDLVSSTTREEYARTWIGSDVWIGSHACIRTGVQIGHGAVVGAGAVVTFDVPAYAIVVGAPARVLRYRFSDEERASLLALAWWDRSIDWIERHADAFVDVGTLRRRLDDHEYRP